jgi:hypothetical protein
MVTLTAAAADDIESKSHATIVAKVSLTGLMTSVGTLVMMTGELGFDMFTWLKVPDIRVDIDIDICVMLMK